MLAGANWSPNGAGGPDAAGATRHHQSTTKHNFPEREHCRTEVELELRLGGTRDTGDVGSMGKSSRLGHAKS